MAMEELTLAYERLEMALLLVSKNDPERRKIAEFLDGRRDS